jgi:peptidoglycan/LPS O-acetylase OafA/YrhL
MGESLKNETTVHPLWGKRLVGIEGLRGLPALAVIRTHSAKRLPTPEAGGQFYTLVGLATHGLTRFFVLPGSCSTRRS